MSLTSTERKDIRRFGLTAFVFFGCLFSLGLWLRRPVPIYLFGFLSVLGLCLVISPARLRLVYAGWLKAAHFAGRVVTMMVLALAYYLLITPSTFLKRIFGGPPLPLRPDKGAASYWVTRTESAQPKERFIKRY